MMLWEVIVLLLTGKWHEWPDEQPVSMVFNFREKEMPEAGAKVVNELLALKELIFAKIETMRANNK